MKRIKNDEIFRNVTKFLKGRGVELTAGSYAERIQKGCSTLTGMINLSRDGIERATTQIDKKLENLRQTLHEATAPKSGGKPAEAMPGAKTGAAKAAKKPAAKPAAKTGRAKSR
jgi:hypothetical protein